MDALVSKVSFGLRDFPDEEIERETKLKCKAMASQHVMVTPGQVISTDTGYLRGHGTYIYNGNLIACVAGVVERVNQLVSVRPIKSRYIGEVGDIVVGRITEVGNNRWKVDVNGHQDAVLLLSSVNLPSGAQRKRTAQDQLNMRHFFVENDLMSAEIQEIRYDGSVWLHTRSLRYGKLENGQFVKVQPNLMKRLKQHVIVLEECGIELILGKNGYIWISRVMPEDEQTGDDVSSTKPEIWLERKKRHEEMPMNSKDRRNIARIYQCITELNASSHIITPERILDLYRSKTNNEDMSMG